MSAREALQDALQCVRRIANLTATIDSLSSGVAGISYDKDGSAGTGSPEWAMLQRVQRIDECRAKISELSVVVDEVAAAIWRIDTGNAFRDLEIGTVLTRLYLDDSKPSVVAHELGTTVDGVRNLKWAGIRWLDRHNML